MHELYICFSKLHLKINCWRSIQIKHSITHNTSTTVYIRVCTVYIIWTVYPSRVPGFTPRFIAGVFGGVHVAHRFSFLFCVFWFLCIRSVFYDQHCLCPWIVCVDQHCLCRWIVCRPALSVSLGCPFLIASSVFSNIYLMVGTSLSISRVLSLLKFRYSIYGWCLGDEHPQIHQIYTGIW